MWTWTWVSGASASPTYPAVLGEHASAPCDVPCTVCHATSAGGGGTVITPFGTAMIERGLTGGSNLELLQATLDGAAELDADLDGVADLDAIAQGIDPATSASLCDVDGPVYGCSTAGPAPASAVLLAVILVAGLRTRA